MEFFNEHQKRLGKQHIKFDLKTNFKSLVIHTDKIKLHQILINLIGNAFKFTENGKIEVGSKFDENGNLLFYITDTGIGIPLDKQEFIFERFAQLDHLNRSYGGTGLGLSIVKGLVNILGGNIWIESKLEDRVKGISGETTFYFTIPLAVRQP
jgi:signal transduction histidine kinase